MGYYGVVALFLCFFLTACAESRVVVDPSRDSEYVEINNPAFTISPGAPQTIWVPRKSVDNGVPRGGQLLKKGYEALTNEIGGSPQEVLPKTPQTSPDENPPVLYRENQFR